MDLKSVSETINFPYLVIREQRKNRQVIRDYIYAPNKRVAYYQALRATSKDTLLLSVERLYKVH